DRGRGRLDRSSALRRHEDRRRHRRHLHADRGSPRRRPPRARDRRHARRREDRRRVGPRGPRRRRDSCRQDDLAPDPDVRRRVALVASIKAGLPVVAIVGRPNVGKSTLFNRIVGKRQAIVEDRARTTRDRMYGDAEWNGRRFVIVDTGGLEVDPADPIELKVQEQARLAIGEADVIVFVVDAVTGLTPSDEEAAELLRRSTKPVIVAANKADNQAREIDAAEFYALGWEETYPISASHGRGTGDLLDAIVWALPPETPEELARKDREKEGDHWARDGATCRLEPFVVGDEEADEDGDGTGGDETEVAARWDAEI